MEPLQEDAAPEELDQVDEQPVEPERVEPEQQPEEAEMAEPADIYSDLGCDALFTLEEFASACGVELSMIEKTYKFGTKNCYVSINHKKDRALTAGLEAFAYPSAEDATEELNRRLKVRMAGASDSTIPGARTYEYSQVGRNNIEFAKGANIVRLHANEELCPEDKLVGLAKKVAGRV